MKNAARARRRWSATRGVFPQPGPLMQLHLTTNAIINGRPPHGP